MGYYSNSHMAGGGRREGGEPAPAQASLQSFSRATSNTELSLSLFNGREEKAPARKPRQPKAAGIFIIVATCLSLKNRFLLPGWEAALMRDGQPCSQAAPRGENRHSDSTATAQPPFCFPPARGSCLLLIALPYN